MGNFTIGNSSEMKNSLLKDYEELCKAWEIRQSEDKRNISFIVKKALEAFALNCEEPAIWGNGNHTKMLMTDFVYELRNVRYIIDNFTEEECDEGYILIGENQIADKRIDGIIISSFQYRKQIKERILENYENIKYLDLYDVLEKHGIKCEMEYYAQNHPYDYYLRINRIKEKITGDLCDKKEAVIELIKIFIAIKDFRMAMIYADSYSDLFMDDEFEAKRKLIANMYRRQLEAAADISNKNVLLLCIDALRRRDITRGLMPKVKRYIEEKMVWFENAYSVSTSTYESLIPAYSENLDLKTRYYEINLISKNGCRFINEAERQQRKVYFYTDTIPFIENPIINVKNELQTASQKMWDFILDAANETNGLFYVHILYESHFSFPNPYTQEPLVAKGTNIFFDFLGKNGGRVKADYISQHRDALSYLDDLLEPFLRKLNLPLLLFADHGISIVEKGKKLEDVERILFTCANQCIEIPLAYQDGHTESKKISSLVSLTDLNGMIVAMLQNREVESPGHEYVKVQRSRIYNPDYISLYKRMEFENGGLAFEAFIFENHYKLVVYENGQTDLYSMDDELLDDEEMTQELFMKIKSEITVF